MADAAARGAQRPLDADRVQAGRRRQPDHRAGLVPAHGLRRQGRQARLVGARAVVRAEVGAGDRRRYALHQRVRVAGERPRPARRDPARVRGVPEERRGQGREAVGGRAADAACEVVHGVHRSGR